MKLRTKNILMALFFGGVAVSLYVLAIYHVMKGTELP
jgi:hypothetical protein